MKGIYGTTTRETKDDSSSPPVSSESHTAFASAKVKDGCCPLGCAEMTSTLWRTPEAEGGGGTMVVMRFIVRIAPVMIEGHDLWPMDEDIVSPFIAYWH